MKCNENKGVLENSLRGTFLYHRKVLSYDIKNAPLRMRTRAKLIEKFSHILPIANLLTL